MKANIRKIAATRRQMLALAGLAESHPALHPNPGYHLLASDRTGTDGNGRHFVPNGWDEADRGVCPCGELVIWDEASKSWIPDRSLRLLVLTQHEASLVVRAAIETEEGHLATTIGYQLDLNEEVV